MSKWLGQRSAASDQLAARKARVFLTAVELHTVDAESLYEAVALAAVAFREEDLIDATPAALTEFVVSVLRKPVEHRLRFNQVLKWAEPRAKNAPGEFKKRERVRELLAPFQKTHSA